MTEQERLEHNEAFETASAILMKEIALHDRPLPSRPGWWSRRRIRKALTKLDRVLQLKPQNWSAMWLIGKAHQRLNDKSTALSWFEKAYQENPSQPDVAREASLCAMDLGRHEAGIVYAHRAAEIEPSNAGLKANLALAHLLAGKISDAQNSIAEALSLDPSDTVSKTINEIVQHFATNKRTPPPNTTELQRYWHKQRSV